MPQPFDYRLNLPNPVQDLLGTVQLAGGIQQLQANRATLEADQVKAERSAQIQRGLARLAEDPRPEAIKQGMLLYPEVSEVLKRFHDAAGADDQRALISQTSQVYMALLNGNTEAATGVLAEIATAYRNAGREQEAREAEFVLKQVEKSPNAGAGAAGAYLLSALGPEQFAQMFEKVAPAKTEPGWAVVSEDYKKKHNLDPNSDYKIKLGGKDKGNVVKIGDRGAAGVGSAREKINQMTLEAWQAFMAKKASPQQLAMIRQDPISVANFLLQGFDWKHADLEERKRGFDDVVEYVRGLVQPSDEPPVPNYDENGNLIPAPR